MVCKGMVQVNGIWIPTPASLKVGVKQLDTSGHRTQDGLLHRNMIGRKKTIDCVWSIIPDTDEYYAFFRIMENLPEFFPFVYPHPNGNNYTSITAYVGDISATMLSYWNKGDRKVSRWRDTSANFIER